MSFDLPIPVVQKQPSDSSLRRKFAYVSRLNCDLVQKTLAAPSSSTVVRESLEGIQHALDNNRYALEEDQAVKVEEVSEDEVVEEVVVDRVWNEASTKTSLKSKALSESDGGEVCSESPASIPGTQEPMKRPALLIVFWTLYSHWQQFFNPRFKDINKEVHYQKENWAHSKRLSLWASVFFIGNWILGAALIPTPAVLLDKVPAVPLVLLCAFNLPRDHTRFYQCFLFISTWSWSYYQVLFGFLCGYSGRNDLFTCGSKDFSSTFYYTTALQTVALFGLDLKRFPALLGAIIFIVLSGFLIIPEKIFLMYMHYQREMSARHLFALRIELKEQFERTQKAQINERKAADSKYRLTSYDSLLLHALLLAVQNMSASGTIVKSLELEFTALEGSLSMMSKVLNDVLDFNRMDSGKFESLSRPYAFHHVMRSMLLPLRLATDARKLELVTDLDMNIDEVARRAAYEALGEDRETIDKHMKEQPSGESHFGIVVGDETRLRQIVTNLASNACKFTPAGGKVIIRTRLILPSSSTTLHNEENEQNSIQDESLTTHNVEKHDEENNPENISRIVVRIEVTDTGSGIKPQDMAQSKLFSAFNQTEQGRQQGGKGTGLGLALVRLIVKLSGGRLGVRSRVEEGSTFWVELPLGIGVKAMLSADENNVFSSPARNLSSNTLRQLIKSKSRSNSTQSKTSIIEAVDAAAQRATQASPMTLRSNNALHRLMDQGKFRICRERYNYSSISGGSVELNLANHESHTAVPTRMIGDRSTGTEIPMEVMTREEPRRSDASTHRIQPEMDNESNSLSSPKSSRRASARPTYVPLPSPKTLAFDSTISTTSSLPTISPTHLPPSPLANRAFPPPSPSNPLFSHPLHVLVVDDDALTRTLMRRMLERMGCDVTTAENGDRALRILLSPDSDGESSSQSCSNSEQPVASDTVSKFHIIFLDNQMPVLSGVKAIAKLRNLGRRDFVVGVTGNALVSDQREYLDAGVDHVLTKPVLERSLRNMLQLADDRRKLP
ncbi:Tco5, signal transduction HAMP domain histidine kinase [Lentinula aff. lateritia]|uniref:Tco5, signal transduction HAMP domain histidine kinase n=1 Tax=Lentinula aff. lateritia TaxID=2804960 RepID=A0ACC1TZD5_9AGAR|nr:Tco5, signal transduction HAMP domain histidine kinase [Lentinula aff. lateritia]